MSKKRTRDPMGDLLSKLLPGMDNEVAVKEIVSKVPWRDSHSLRALNSTWRRAFRSGLVYDARVRSQTTEKFFLAVCKFNHSLHYYKKCKLFRYSLNKDCWYKLPPIPGYSSGLPKECKCVPLDGEVYVMGGRKSGSVESIGEVYMLDLAGQVSHWEQCKNMQVPRSRFGVSVMDGMIFVFEGVSDGEAINRSEKYDPKADVWSETQPSIGFYDENPYAVGKEVFLFGGKVKTVDILWRDLVQGPYLLPVPGGMLPRDQPSDDEGNQDPSNDDNDSSEDEAEDPVNIGDDDPSDAEETEDQFIITHDSWRDENWIKLIDQDLFRDDDSDRWFLQDVKFKHGVLAIIEEQGVRKFDEEIKNERQELWDDLSDVTSYAAYDTGDDKWRKVDNVSRDDLKEICLHARPTKAPFYFDWEFSQNPLIHMGTYLPVAFEFVDQTEALQQNLISRLNCFLWTRQSGHVFPQVGS